MENRSSRNDLNYQCTVALIVADPKISWEVLSSFTRTHGKHFHRSHSLTHARNHHARRAGDNALEGKPLEGGGSTHGARMCMCMLSLEQWKIRLVKVPEIIDPLLACSSREKVIYFSKCSFHEESLDVQRGQK